MSLKKTYQVERSKWNALAQQKIPQLSILAPGDNFYRYAQRTATMVGVNDFLGDLCSKHVLEIGCGLGEISILLAKTGAKVTTFDLSAASVAATRQRSALNGVAADIDLVVAAGENLPFAGESFDVIFGKAILHHLDVNLGWFDLYRTLKTGGKAVFIEPMGMNPILKFVRAYLPYPHKNPRGADRPLNYDEIHAWGKGFKKFHYHEFQLLSMLERGLGFKKRLNYLRRLDTALLKQLPFLRRYCRYVVMFMVK